MARGTIDIMHEEFIKKALKRTGGSKRESAKLLGITERTLFNKIELYGINKKPKPCKMGVVAYSRN